jgi:hypothetical protein
MRYYFDNEAVSLVNRVLDIAARTSVTGTTYGEPEEQERAYSYKYGFENYPLLAAMWYQVEVKMDWGGESDAIDDAYPELKKAGHKVAHLGNPVMSPAEVAYYDAEGLALDFENKLLLAVYVAGAIRNLETDTRNIWDLYGKILDETEPERDKIKTKINNLLKPFPELA